MKRAFSFFLFLALITFSKTTHAQTTDTSEVYTFVEQMPEYPGGVEKMYAFISENVVYPPYCKKNGIEGKVVLTFIVTETGHINNIVVLKSAHPLMSDEAVRVISVMPNWKPGKQNGKAIKVKYTLPIAFRLK